MTWLARQRFILPARLARYPVTGIVWQLDTLTARPEGEWQRLGANHLLVQWSLIDGIGFVPGLGHRSAAPMPDWQRIGAEPWAQHVILGLAGNFSEKKSRANVMQLAKASAEVAAASLPLNIEGYYFPVEVDPTWQEAPEVMPEALALLPRPLWISVYDNTNIGGDVLADWLAGWLPDDIGIFFQDGVGVEARSPEVARQYADALSARLGRARVRIITEAFRPLAQARFRPATADELEPQIRAMHGYEVYLFEGPHYLNDELVEKLKERLDAYRPASTAVSGGVKLFH
nr:hypothetical protein [Marinicella sp. W31]MDC2879262.1 hypothetical protein [Marinicella sp. W31]